MLPVEFSGRKASDLQRGSSSIKAGLNRHTHCRVTSPAMTLDSHPPLKHLDEGYPKVLVAWSSDADDGLLPSSATTWQTVWEGAELLKRSTPRSDADVPFLQPGLYLTRA